MRGNKFKKSHSYSGIRNSE